VADRNVTDVIVGVPGAVDVAGRIRLSEQGVEAPHQKEEQPGRSEAPRQQVFRMESLRINMFPAEGLGVGSMPTTTANVDGSFILRHIVPDKVRVTVAGTAAGWYLKSILASGRESRDGTVLLTGSGLIEIVLARGAAGVSGSVVDADGKPVSSADVTLIPKDAEQARMDLFRSERSDQNGRFRFSDVVPGSYEIFAWQGVEPGAAEDPELRREFDSDATPLKLDENGHETVVLKAITGEAVARVLGNSP
jgi:hypothetical protein